MSSVDEFLHRGERQLKKLKENFSKATIDENKLVLIGELWLDGAIVQIGNEDLLEFIDEWNLENKKVELTIKIGGKNES